MSKIISGIFDWGKSYIVCNNYDQILDRSKKFIENENSILKEEIKRLYKEFYHTGQHGLVKDRIINHLSKNFN